MPETSSMMPVVSAHGTSDAPRAAETECLVVRLDDELYAIELARGAEVHQLVAATAAPDAAGGLVGYVDIRGRTVPALDLRAALGAPTRPWTASMHMVVARAGDEGDELVALAVDRVDGVVPATLDARGSSHRPTAVSAVARAGGLGLVPVLDPAALLAATVGPTRRSRGRKVAP